MCGILDHRDLSSYSFHIFKHGQTLRYLKLSPELLTPSKNVSALVKYFAGPMQCCFHDLLHNYILKKLKLMLVLCDVGENPAQVDIWVTIDYH